MDFDFDDFTGYDVTKADVGVWKTEVRGTTKLEFCVRYRDQFTQAAEAEYKRARAPFAKEIEAGKIATEIEFLTIALAYVHLADWKGITAKGKPVKFSSEAAYKFFCHENNKWMVQELMVFANNASNFAPEIEANADEVTKN